MTDPTDIRVAFDKFMAGLNADMTLRHQFWLAFSAGALYALQKFTITGDDNTTKKEPTP